MAASPDFSDSGIVLVDKPQDWTSHDVVNCIRRRFRIKKVGHCGTLDPIATGLLVIVCGKATKLSTKLTTQDKVYTGTMRIGSETNTEDRAGEVVATGDFSAITPEDIRAAAAKFVGDIEQIPPMVSAIKKNGQPLYKLARKGQEIEREPRPVTIHSFEIGNVAIPDAEFTVHCSKGTYVRTLCADVGRELGCGAHMYELRRLRSGRFDVENAVTIEAIKSWEKEEFLTHMTPLGDVLIELMKEKGIN